MQRLPLHTQTPHPRFYGIHFKLNDIISVNIYLEKALSLIDTQLPKCLSGEYEELSTGGETLNQKTSIYYALCIKKMCRK